MFFYLGATRALPQKARAAPRAALPRDGQAELPEDARARGKGFMLMELIQGTPF